MSVWASGYVTDVNYTHGFYRELTPSLLSLACLVCGRHSPVASVPLTYCELGCGQGFTTNLLAAANPHIEFYANDFNPAHIAGARNLADQAGTSNVHFFEDSFEEFLDEPSIPNFDIISLHGIYSWISSSHRATIINFIRRKLKPGGIVYISYNCLPGWTTSAPLRHLLYLHGKTQGGMTASRLAKAFEFADQLQIANAAYFRANPSLEGRVEKLKKQPFNYLAHEYMNDSWNLFYHADIASELGEAKLSFVGSAALLDHIDSINLTAEQREIVSSIAEPAFRETVRDYMWNQQFRRDIFIKGNLALTRLEADAGWNACRFALSTPLADVSMKVTGYLGEATLQPEIYLPLLKMLDNGPKNFGQLRAEMPSNDLHYHRLLQALTVLVGAGYVHPCLPENGDHVRRKRTEAFNRIVMQRARESSDLSFLASPVTGSGIAVGRFHQLFLLAIAEGYNQPSDWAEFTWDLLSAQKQRLTVGDKLLETDKENLEEINLKAQIFLEKSLPVLKNMKIF